ncbi:MAG: hypothetical protein JW860_08300 [Sedimentisphaerales bacterium]|nr:hypothetical protein [Sedimentisphaerales bacterium]
MMYLKRCILMGMMFSCLAAGGCGDLRFAPGQEQKQNAYLHHRTVQAAAIRADHEDVSGVLKQLTSQATRQSEAIMAYYGLPDEIPAGGSVTELLGEESNGITQQALVSAAQRPDPWDVADDFLELGIALAGVAGGVLGTRAAGALKLARQKSQALREIVSGNELFKQARPDQADDFKNAQQHQSQSTRELVVAMK